MRRRADRAEIREEWIQRAIDHPIKESLQADGRIRLWTRVAEMDGRYLRVIMLPDRETVHNAFFDRSFKPCKSCIYRTQIGAPSSLRSRRMRRIVVWTKL